MCVFVSDFIILPGYVDFTANDVVSITLVSVNHFVIRHFCCLFTVIHCDHISNIFRTDRK